MRPPLILAGLAALFVLLSSVGTAGAQTEVRAQPRQVELIKVEGIIDPSIASYVRATIDQAENAGHAVVLQIDSRGSFKDEAIRLAGDVAAASVPVVAWIGPAGARVEGGALFLVYSSSLVAMAPGAGIGPARPFDLATTASREDPSAVRRLSQQLLDLSEGSGARPEGIRRLLDGGPLAARPALDAGAVAVLASDLLGGEGQDSLMRAIDGREVRTGQGQVTLATVGPRGQLDVAMRFHDLGPIRRIFHAVSTPTAVYVLLILGLWGLAFELTQPGVGVAGIAAVLSLALAAYGLTVVPVHWGGIVLILLGTGLMALDVLVKRVGVLTLGGAALFAGGSVWAWWRTAPAIDLPLWLIVLATLGAVLFFGFALTVALKAKERIQSSQVGLVGLLGEARGDIDPEGAVFVKGTLWRARSMDGRIAKGKRVRIRGIDGLILRVEEESE